MPTPTLPTRAQIDRADPLSFDGVRRGDDPSLAENVSAKIARKRAEAERAADALNQPQIEAPTQPAASVRAMTIQISAVIDGFAVAVAFEGRMEQLPGAIERLRALGATPTTGTPLQAPVASADDLPDGWKLCRKHGAPMRPRQKQGDTWHSHNVGSEDAPCWCKGYAGSDSPGYDR